MYSNEVQKIHGAFIDNIINELSKQGIDSGYTNFSTPKDERGFPYIAVVIAKKKKGWKSRLPFGFKYDTSKEGILMRIYGTLHHATEDPLVKEIVDRLAPDYTEKMVQLSKEIDRKLSREEYVLDNNINYGKSFNPEPTFV